MVKIQHPQTVAMGDTAMNGRVVGIDLGGTKLLLRCVNTQETFPTGPAFTPEDLIQHTQSFVLRHGISPERIGLAIPGLVEKSERVAECDVLPAFQEWQAKRAMQVFCNRVAVVNDVEAAMLEEMQHAPPDVTGGVVMVGTGIGAAFVANGQLLLGASGWAGELGYLPIVCSDHTKRLDDIASGAAIAKRCDTDPATVAHRANNSEPSALLAIEQAGSALGFGLAAVINLLNPSVLSVGGGTTKLPGYWEAALASAQRNTLPELWRDCNLSKVKAGKSVVVLGAIRAAVAQR